MDDLCGRFRGPGHPADGLRVRPEHDIDLRRAHRLTGLRRIVTGHRLQEHTFGQPHAAVFRELLGGHDLAARDAGHVRDDGLDLGDAVVAQKLPDLAHHNSTLLPDLAHHNSALHFACPRSRLAAPKAANSARENGLLITFHSGCH